jgi:methionyl-tRNA synthetase
MNRRFYITTPIFYVNARPHIGSAYTTIAADILARFHRQKGEEVFYLTGTDENSVKNVAAAKEARKDVKDYLDEMAAVWQETWDSLGISNDDFIRTTERRHIEAVFKFFKEVKKKGDIYEGVYEGYYCDGCEAFLSKDDLVDNKCPTHKKAPEYLREKNLFFRLTKYRDKLLNHIEKNPEFIEPVSRRNEVVSYIKDFMTDFSISREGAGWGIHVPEETETKRVLYVWFDALINYISAIGYATDEKKFKKWWPVDVHLIGKDIIKFHCAYWPAMLMSAGLPLPKKVFAHGFFTIDGQKISKSLGNAIDPVEASKKYGIDALRYFLIHEIKFGEDGDFSFRRLEEVYNSELANELGNLVNRVLSMVEKYFNSKIPKPTKLRNGYENYEKVINDYEEAMEELRLHDAVEAILSLVRFCNQLIDKERPWELAKKDLKHLADVIYFLLDALRILGWMLWPITPEAAEKIWEQLGVSEEKEKKWEKGVKLGGLKAGTKIKKGEPLFPKIETLK